MPETEGKVRVRLAVAEATRNELRVLAAKTGLSMSEYAEAVVEEAVKQKRLIQPKPVKPAKRSK